MRQGRIHRIGRLMLLAALLLVCVGSSPASARAVATPAKSARDSKSEDGSTPRRNTLRQFTGYVSAVDKSSITVEKRGKNPETRVFTKLDDMRSSGDVGKDSRVTVYYRMQDGKAVAHRVVVKPARAGAGGS